MAQERLFEEDIQYIDFQCLVATQPIGLIYVGVMDYDDLEFIAYADVRRLELGIDNREVEDYIGIQRKLSKSREAEIGHYVNLVDATFPNSIILAISKEYAEYDEGTKIMKIRRKDDVAKVLDGQHRIAGLREFQKEGKDFQCVVSIYIDMDIEDQAIVFATINKEQKNVSNSLAQDLFAFAKTKSPQKTAHNVVRALYKNPDSPFFKKIKILGTANSKEETITQDTFAKNLIKYISKNAKSAQEDRNFYKVNKGNKKAKLPLLTDKKEKQALFLRNMFINDDSDVNIAQLIWNYFYAVQQKWPTAWNTPDIPTNILNKSTGFIALMRFLKDAYLSFGEEDKVIEKAQFVELFNKITLTDDDFNTERYLPGSTGQGKLYQDFLTQSGLNTQNSNQTALDF